MPPASLGTRPGDRWFVDETYVKVNGVWRFVYRAVDQHGQIIDVLVSARRDADAARRLFRRALTILKVTPVEVVTDAAPVYPRILDEPVPAAWHHVEQYENNRIEADHSRPGIGYDPCAVYAPTAPPASSSPGSRSPTTSAEATTTLPPKQRALGGWPPHSPSSRQRSEGQTQQDPPRPASRQRNGADDTAE
jgi:IS1 family transposase